MRSSHAVSFFILPGFLAGLLMTAPCRAQQTPAENPQISDQQRADYKLCCSTLEKLRNRTLDTVHLSIATPVDLDAVRESQSMTRAYFGKVEENRMKLRYQINAKHPKDAAARMHQLDILRDRTQQHLDAIDRIVAAPTLDVQGLQKEARLSERAMRAYEMHFHELADELGVEMD